MTSDGIRIRDQLRLGRSGCCNSFRCGLTKLRIFYVCSSFSSDLLSMINLSLKLSTNMESIIQCCLLDDNLF